MSTITREITANSIKKDLTDAIKNKGLGEFDFTDMPEWANKQSSLEHKEAILYIYNKYKDSKYAIK